MKRKWRVVPWRELLRRLLGILTKLLWLARRSENKRGVWKRIWSWLWEKRKNRPRSVMIRFIDGGSGGAVAVEVASLTTRQHEAGHSGHESGHSGHEPGHLGHDIGRLGIQIVSTPAHSDWLLVTLPLSPPLVAAVVETIKALPTANGQRPGKHPVKIILIEPDEAMVEWLAANPGPDTPRIFNLATFMKHLFPRAVRPDIAVQTLKYPENHVIRTGQVTAQTLLGGLSNAMKL